MYILGASCFYHDAAAALIKDGVLLCAAEEERFSRKKHDYSYPRHAIDFCLSHAGITADNLDFAVFHEKPFRKLDRIMKTIIETYPRSAGVFSEAMKNWLSEKLWIKSILRERLPIAPEKILFTEHHLSHAAGAFLVSPFEEAAILTLDGVGEWATAALGIGKNNQITLLKELHFPDSLGLLYSAFTAFLGFEVNEGEYKVMGMAPYGIPRFSDTILSRLVCLHDDGSFTLNKEYFSFSYSTRKSFTKKFEKLFGKPRPVDRDFFTGSFDFPAYFGEKPADYEPRCKENQYYADVAASIQNVTEEIILKQARYLHRITGRQRLCIAGGVGLNSTANGRLLKEGPFKELFVQPAPGDSGAAIGAALYAYNSVLGNKRSFTFEHAYWGKEYSNQEIREFLTTHAIPFKHCNNEDELIAEIVAALMNGRVIGWFQGRFEWGPRALGNRSILADPRDKKMKDIVNLKIKFREPFRPFAPVILENELENFFELPCSAGQYPLRFMLLVLPIKEEKRGLIPAVDHNGTGRVQAIRENWNPRYYRLVEAFGKKTGVPVLLNTSFNLKGEPIVNTPENAYTTFMKSGLDALVMGDYIIIKENKL